jgi:hypothetical protein
MFWNHWHMDLLLCIVFDRKGYVYNKGKKFRLLMGQHNVLRKLTNLTRLTKVTNAVYDA